MGEVTELTTGKSRKNHMKVTGNHRKSRENHEKITGNHVKIPGKPRENSRENLGSEFSENRPEKTRKAIIRDCSD